MNRVSKVIYQLIEQIEFWPSAQNRDPRHGKRLVLLVCQHVIIRRASEPMPQKRARCYLCEQPQAA